MHRLSAWLCLGLWLFSALGRAQVAPIPLPANASFSEDRILVKRKEFVPPEAWHSLHSVLGTRVLHVGASSRIVIVSLPKAMTVMDALHRYRARSEVEYAEPDFFVQAALTAPNDPRYRDGTQWGLNNLGLGGGVPDADINAPEAWDTLIAATNVIVAIVDSGVRYTHLDLRANLWTSPHDGGHGLNALTGSNDPWDDFGHGTLLAGVIGAHGNNGFGIAGVAWRVQLMACKFFDATGQGRISDAIVCVDYARTNGAKVINASWGTLEFSQALRDVLADAAESGVVVAAAAGNFANDDDQRPFFPACYDLSNVVSVAALTRSNTLWETSNYGAEAVDLAAPGLGIYSTSFGGDDFFASANGTSLSTAYASGALALLAARFPQMTATQLVARLLEAATPVASLAGRCKTGGRLNLAAALGPSLVTEFTCTPQEGGAPLLVQFTDRSFGVITNRVWDFGDGTQATNLTNPSHLFAQPGAFTASLTVSSDKGLVASTTNVVRVLPNYQVLPMGFRWIGARDVALTLEADEVSAAIPLPFPFWFYGRRYDTVYVGANGVMGFAPEGLNRVRGNLPTEETPNALLAPCWTELNPGDGRSIFLGTKGAAPQRVFCVTWQGVAMATHRSGPRRLSFQAVLFEENHCVLFQYLHGLGSLDQPVTIGIENETGRVGVVQPFAPALDRQALLFVPPSNDGEKQDDLDLPNGE